jgi:phosphoglycolate phosphatase-like HAD superfamily hydrolase
MSLDKTRIRALCFDVDGTLRDTDDQYVERLAGYLKPASFLLPGKEPQVIARRLIMAIEDPGNFILYLADVIGIDNLISRLPHTGQRTRTRKTTHPLIIPGVSEMLGALGQRYPMAIISTRSQQPEALFLCDCDRANLCTYQAASHASALGGVPDGHPGRGLPDGR